MIRCALLLLILAGSLYGQDFHMGGSVSTLYFSNKEAESAPPPIKNVYNLVAEWEWRYIYAQLSVGAAASVWEAAEGGIPVPTEQYTAAAIETLDLFIRPRVGYRHRISSFAVGATLSWALMLPLVTEARGGVDEDALAGWFTTGLNLYHGEGRIVGEYFVSEKAFLSLSVDYLKFFSENFALGCTVGFHYTF